MLQFVSSEKAKAESMSRRNHLHDELRWMSVGMLDQNASRRRGSGRRRITTTADNRYLLQCVKRRRTLTERQLASQLYAAAKGPYPAKLCSADCIKGDCSYDHLLFVCLCLKRTSERGYIGPMDNAVGHQSSGATYSLQMSLDLTSRTIPEGHCYGESQGHAIGCQTSSKETIIEVAGYLSGQG
ncbi:hypothetical protein AVEN_42601-1 [Araneus ventricosus]|uniref:Uncharacterized protein n=1 Tax=Araneus ventricosus TaxID=182803 RepID=A0A4Y2JTH3_ARAVE|nr:hypothetical protein AVEN_42601-1 [Araneus ventricosus]